MSGVMDIEANIFNVLWDERFDELAADPDFKRALGIIEGLIADRAVKAERERILTGIKKTMLSHNIWVVRNIVNGRPPYGP
jgi:hypothetical protein